MKKVSQVFAVTTVFLSACATDPYTGQEKVSNSGIGAGAGAAIGAASGALIGGDGTGALIGAAAGAALGGGIGLYMDRQEDQLRNRLQGTGVQVQRQGDNLKLIMPGNITFATDSADISANFFPVLDSVATVLAEFDDTSINISGYTDSTGSDMHNQILSESRANSVASYLVRSHVHHGRIQARGFGERYPIASNDTAVGRAQNRRVEISIRPR